MGRPARILIADDSRHTRAGLRALLGAHSGWEIVGEATNGRETLAQVARYRPDGVLLDLHMPLLDGIQTARLLKERWPEIAIVVLSMDAGLRSRALAAGADAFVSKADEAHEVVRALQRVCGPGSVGGDTTDDLA